MLRNNKTTIAIHNRKGSYSDYWIQYCTNNGIQHRIVNCYDNNIIEQIKDCQGLMWHHHHADYKDTLFAKQLLYSLQQSGKKVFPDFHTTWHFDDKIGQKYLFEALEIPFVPTYVFYTKKEALNWVKNTKFPKVFKLRKGAGSMNVRLINTKGQAKQLIKKAFGKGFPTVNKKEYLKSKYLDWKQGNDKLGLLKAITRLFISSQYRKMSAFEKGYVYFQDYIPNAGYDVRVQLVKDKAIAMVRNVRKNDFRASGSGDIDRSSNIITKELIDFSFQVFDKLNMQACALDIIKDKRNDKLFIVECSYCYGVDKDEFDYGYWLRNGIYIKDEKFNGIDWIIEDFLHSVDLD